MIKAFKERKPWAAAIIGLFLSPIIGMLYLNRGRLAFGYFLIFPLLIGLLLTAAHYGILAVNIVDAQDWLLLALTVVGVIHCYVIARDWEAEPLKWYTHWYSLLLFFLVPLALATGFRHFLYEPFHTPSQAMRPAIELDDVFFVDKRAYSGSHPPERGDIIVFLNPRHPRSPFVKRIIGLPGERIQLKAGTVYINDIPLQRHPIESYVDDIHNKSIPRFTEIMPEGKEIVILREYPGIAEDTPLYHVPSGQYFVMGDDRNHSRDSRSDDIGYVSQESIIGKATFVYWNQRTLRITYKTLN